MQAQDADGRTAGESLTAIPRALCVEYEFQRRLLGCARRQWCMRALITYPFSAHVSVVERAIAAARRSAREQGAPHAMHRDTSRRPRFFERILSE